MAIDFGKLERLIEVPSGNWTATLLESAGGGNQTVTLTAGDESYLSSAPSGADFLARLKTALEAASANTRTYTVSITATEGGTGLVTIAVDSGTFTLTWVATDLRDLLGYTGNLTPTAASFAGTNQAKSLWLPGVPMVTPYGPSDDGTDESDARWTESPAGHVKALFGQRKRIMTVLWPVNSRAKTRIAGESTTNESFERFYQEGILAEATWAVGIGGPLRLYWDADVDTGFFSCKCVGEALREFRPIQVTEGWIEQWRIELDRMVKLP